MGDSTCLMHGFSYASAIPNESKQENAMHVLGESISFGRFMTEPLSWEKWSSFSSHKKYVEEAQSYAQPGSVAQKKAFFEAHYKRIAAQRAAAAALLEQQNAVTAECEPEGDNDRVNAVLDPRIDIENSGEAEHLVTMEQEQVQDKSTSVDLIEPGKDEGNELAKIDVNNQETVSGSDGSITSQKEERPLLKNCESSEGVFEVTSKKKSGLPTLKSSIQRKTWKVPSTPVIPKPISPRFKNVNTGALSSRKSSNMDTTMDKNGSSPKSLRKLINSMPFKEPDKVVNETAVLTSSQTPKNSRMPWKTPVKVTPNVGSKHVAATPTTENRWMRLKHVATTPTTENRWMRSEHVASTPVTENRRLKTPIDSSARGSKTNGPKWHILSAVCAKSLTACRNKLQSPTTLSTPFVLRTEERAAKRKQKLEEKFIASDNQKAQQQQQKTLKEKAGNELRKLSCTFCFKARPLPDFYKEREMSVINQIKKASPAGRIQSAVTGKLASNKKQGTASMPSAPLFPSSLAKNSSGSMNVFKKNESNPTKGLSSSFRERMAVENRSPNIQH